MQVFLHSDLRRSEEAKPFFLLDERLVVNDDN